MLQWGGRYLSIGIDRFFFISGFIAFNKKTNR